MSKQDLLQNRINGMKNSKNDVKNAEKPNAVKAIIEGEEKPDFKKMAEELQKRHEQESEKLDDNHVKDTIYIQKDIYKAFSSLCLKHGDKKKYVNEALADFVQKKYKEIMK